jgi:hypothetical protein
MIGLLVLVIGWLTVGFWTMTGRSDLRWRGIIRGALAITAGTCALISDWSAAWTRVFTVTVGVLLAVNVFWTTIFKSKQP